MITIQSHEKKNKPAPHAGMIDYGNRLERGGEIMRLLKSRPFLVVFVAGLLTLVFPAKHF
jgi:hypothetical protein